MLVRVTDSFGNELYNSSVGRAGIDVGINLLALADTGFLIVGNTREYNSNDNNVEVLRFDKNANVIWDSIYGDMFQNGVQGVLQCSDGNFIFYGETEVFQSSPFEIFMHKINQNGNSLWWQTLRPGRRRRVFYCGNNKWFYWNWIQQQLATGAY